ncbi:MAG: metallophosphoesterase family protein [Hyphomicrobiaceae bacterium]|nr:metallophosphoesterase family protein [Hyphomicrobiaceae bacterium]
MKLLAVADLHYSLRQFDWVIEVAPNYDMVILAGDMLDIASMVDPAAQIVVIREILRKFRSKAPLLVCSGNHDLDGDESDGERHARWLRTVRSMDIPVDGDTLHIDETTLTLCPWWDGTATRDGIGLQLEKASGERRRHWIWLYHAPPTDSPISWSGQRHFGDPALTEWVTKYQPDLVFCGHVHEAPFQRNGSWIDRIGKTWLFNAGRQIGDVPTSISIDTDLNKAAWFSLEGAEAADLDQPLTRPLPELLERPVWLPY